MTTTTAPAEGVRIRPIEAEDDLELARFYGRLSEDSRRLRFFAVTRGLSHSQSIGFCTPDHAHREGFVATLADGASDVTRIVGHVCLEPAGAGRAEMAVAVADELQRLGVGRRLMAAAIEWAQREDVEVLTATMLAANAGIHRLVRSLGLPTRITLAGADTAIVEIAVPAPRVRAA